MDKDFLRGLAPLGILAAAVWALMRRTGTSPVPTGEVQVMGSVGSVQAATHGRLKTPGNTATITVDYSTTATKDGAAVAWKYRLRVEMIHSNPALSSSFASAAPELPNLANGPHSAVVTLTVPAALGLYNVNVMLDAANSVGGQPGTQWAQIATLAHLNAVEAISSEVMAQGSVTTVAVAQGRIDRMGI